MVEVRREISKYLKDAFSNYGEFKHALNGVTLPFIWPIDVDFLYAIFFPLKYIWWLQGLMGVKVWVHMGSIFL